MKVYVVVVTYNGAKWIDKCIGSLFNSSIELHVIVVDNSSTDNTVEYIKSEYPKTIVIEAGGNFGFGKANNIGIRKALDSGFDYLFLLNQDAWVDPGTIEGLINVNRANPKFGVLSPIHLNGEAKSMDYQFSVYCNENDCKGFISDAYLLKYEPVYEIKFVNAALWLISRDCFEATGLFDPLFPHYGEDLDYLNRVHKHNFKVGICPHFRGYHDREYRAPSLKRERAMKQLGLLCILKDINLTYPSAVLRTSFMSIKYFFKNMLSLQFKEAWLDILQMFKLYALSPDILRSRKEAIFPRAYLKSS